MRKSEGGCGGRRGHSNMSHYATTHVVKANARRIRRENDVFAIDEQVDELEERSIGGLRHRLLRLNDGDVQYPFINGLDAYLWHRRTTAQHPLPGGRRP